MSATIKTTKIVFDDASEQTTAASFIYSNRISNYGAESDVLGSATYLDSDAVTFTDAGDLVNLTAHGLFNGDIVSFTVIATTTGILINTAYYVVGVTANTFQVSATSGGSALALTTNGSGTLVRNKPVNATGGSATTTITRTTTNPLDGAGSYLLTKDAANRQGEGVSYDFTIEDSDLGKELVVSFDYILNSGTFVAGSDSVDSDVTVWIYDITNSQLIYLGDKNLYSNSTTVSHKFISTFSPNLDSNSYRLILHVSSVSALAHAIKFDNVFVGSRPQMIASPITDWVSYTPTTTGFGTLASTDVYWRRVGSNLELRGRIVIGSPTATPGLLYFPSGLTTHGDVENGDLAGKVISDSSLTAQVDLQFICSVSASYVVLTRRFGLNSNNPVSISSNADAVIAPSASLQFQLSIPISGWGSSIQVADIENSRPVEAIYKQSGTTTVGAAPIDFATKVKDTHSAVTTGSGWKFTAPSHGTYVLTIDGMQANGIETLAIHKNDSLFRNFFSFAVANTFVSASTKIELNAGDFIHLEASSTNTKQDGQISIVKRNTAQIIGTDKKIRCNVSYHGNAGYGTSPNLKIPYFTTNDVNINSGQLSIVNNGTLGLAITVLEAGKYAIGYTDNFTGVGQVGISLNSSERDTNILAMTNMVDMLDASTTATSGSSNNAHRTLWLEVGDVIRPHGSGSASTSSGSLARFYISKVG